jgi:hypothetical protein
MSNQGYAERQFANALEIGYKNRDIMPSIKNWCKHIIVDDISAGMVAQIYHLPITLAIKCPHASGGQGGMQLEAMARDFIVESCIGCKYHEEVRSDNLGVKILQEHTEKETAREFQLEQDQKKREILKAEVDDLIKHERSSSETTKLSILTLVQRLEEPGEKMQVSSEILAASKLKPDYFSQASVDFLSMYLNDEEGENIQKSLLVLQENGVLFSEFAKANLLAVIETHKYSDPAVGVLSSTYSDDELLGNTEFLRTVLNNCNYHRFYWTGKDFKGSYLQSVQLFSRLYKIDKPQFVRLITENLMSEYGIYRINTNGFLVDLCEIDPKVVTGFTDILIKSFELEDEEGGDSSYYRVRMTLKELYMHDPESLVAHIENSWANVSESIQLELVEFYEDVLKDNETFNHSTENSTKILDALIQKMLSNTTVKNVGEKLPEIMEHISKVRAELFSGHFDVFFGYLTKVIQDLLTFRWHFDELKDQDKPTTTFNPLWAQPYINISLQEMELDKKIRNAEGIIRHIIKTDPAKYYPLTVLAINKLESKKDGLLKSRLIDLLRNSLKDPVLIAAIVPDIYKFIYDPDSEPVRNSGVKFVNHIIENHPEITTQTFLDTIKIFLDDQSILIKTRAIEGYEALLRNFPEHYEANSVDKILTTLTNEYIIVQKATAKLSHAIYPFLDGEKRKTWLLGLIGQEPYYYEKKDYDYCGKLIDYLLFMTVNLPVYNFVVTKLLVKYCDTDDYYTNEKFIGKLSYISEKKPEYQDLWLKKSIDFLIHTNPPEFHSGREERTELYAKMYKIGHKEIEENKTIITGFIIDRIDKGLFRDVIDAFGVLAFHGFYEELKSMVEYFKEKVPENASNQFINGFNALVGRISETELAVIKKLFDADLIKGLKGV